jgi:hypothetical protein
MIMNTDPTLEAHDPSPPRPLATLVLDGTALREALVEALLDPRVLEKLAAAHAARGLSLDGTLPRFMNGKEYAKHTRISERTLSYLRGGMTEGEHYSKTGTRVRYHVKEADQFVAQSKRAKTVEAREAEELSELARKELAKRRIKPSNEEKSQ